MKHHISHILQEKVREASDLLYTLLYFGQFLEFLSDSQGQWKHLRHQYKIYWDTFRPAGAKRVVHPRFYTPFAPLGLPLLNL